MGGRRSRFKHLVTKRSFRSKKKSCRANYRLPSYSKIDLQTIFRGDFYTIPVQKTPPRPVEPLELLEHLKIKLKSTQILETNIWNFTVTPKNNPLYYLELRTLHQGKLGLHLERTWVLSSGNARTALDWHQEVLVGSQLLNLPLVFPKAIKVIDYSLRQ